MLKWCWIYFKNTGEYMKKIMFIQNEGNVVGGVWYVNKTLAEEFAKKGFDVEILSVRNNQMEKNVSCGSRVKLSVINGELPWNLVRKKTVIEPLKKLDIISFFKRLRSYFVSKKTLLEDYEKMRRYITKENPDYIIASQYQVLKGIPKSFFNKTVYEHHRSFDMFKIERDNYKVIKKYNDLIFGYVWLSKSALNKAVNAGFKNNYCIYNPVRFSTNNQADVLLNKKLVVISRIENTLKRINLMIELVDKVFKNSKYKEWVFEIYGLGDLDEDSKKIIKNNNQIVYKGPTDNPKDVLLSSSINLNTSVSEGFSLSILEASMCGVPTVTFNHGEAVFEEVLDNNTGFVVKQNDNELYVKKLEILMSNDEKLKSFSDDCKEYSNNFLVSNIIDDWLELLKKIDKENL